MFTCYVVLVILLIMVAMEDTNGGTPSGTV